MKTLRQGRSKKKGKRLTKKEVAQIAALKALDKSDYEVGMIMGRSPHTVKQYMQSALFTDPKFIQLVEEYKQKELIDLTAINIVARQRIHELLPTMSPIEAVAVMDRSFQQRRLLEGKSTENVFSLRKIISDAHSVEAVHESQGHITVVSEGETR